MIGCTTTGAHLLVFGWLHSQWYVSILHYSHNQQKIYQFYLEDIARICDIRVNWKEAKGCHFIRCTVQL